MSIDITHTSMETLQSHYPSMRRALFSTFHIGGCQSCAYSDKETLQSVCERNSLDLQEVMTEIVESDKRDQAMMLPPQDLNSLLKSSSDLLLLDTRTREEFEAVKIESAQLLTQDLQNSLFTPDNSGRFIVLYDHLGKHALDTCSWFHGHGLKKTKILKGGIDLWAQEIDPSLQRYRLEVN